MALPPVPETTPLVAEVVPPVDETVPLELLMPLLPPPDVEAPPPTTVCPPRPPPLPPLPPSPPDPPFFHFESPLLEQAWAKPTSTASERNLLLLRTLELVFILVLPDVVLCWNFRIENGQPMGPLQYHISTFGKPGVALSLTNRTNPYLESRAATEPVVFS